MSVIRFLAPKSAKSTGCISILCHVKPGASAKREGISSVTSDLVTLCVSAQAKEGEANKAVQKMISSVGDTNSIILYNGE